MAKISLAVVNALIPLAGLVALGAQGCAARAAAKSLPDVEAVVEFAQLPGRPCVTPKLISGRFDDADLVSAQHVWLTKNYPGWRLLRQSLVLAGPPDDGSGGKSTTEDEGGQDVLEIVTSDGNEIAICFSLSLPRATNTRNK